MVKNKTRSFFFIAGLFRHRAVRVLVPVFVFFGIMLCAGGAVWYMQKPSAVQAEIDRLFRNFFDTEKEVTITDVVRDLLAYEINPRGIAPESLFSDSMLDALQIPVHTAHPHALQILKNRGYTTGYCRTCGNPAWVIYTVDDPDMRIPLPPRPATFFPDSRTLNPVTTQLYTRSGYQRGHMAPNAVIARCHGAEAQKETFLMTNIVPQKKELNTGLWRTLEGREYKNFAPRFGKIRVTTGPVYPAKNDRFIQGKVRIPAAFYKILMVHNSQGLTVYAFIMNQEQTGRSLYMTLSSVDKIEAATGLDFFSALPDDLENQLESRVQDAL